MRQYNSTFDTNEISHGISTINDISETVYTMDDQEGTLRVDYDDISMNTENILTRFDGTSGTLGFDKNSFFTLYWGLNPFGIINLPMLFMLIDQVYIAVIKF